MPHPNYKLSSPAVEPTVNDEVKVREASPDNEISL
jgi:hypothetical protein